MVDKGIKLSQECPVCFSCDFKWLAVVEIYIGVNFQNKWKRERK